MPPPRTLSQWDAIMLDYTIDESDDGGDDIVSLSERASRIVEHTASVVPAATVPAEHAVAHTKATAGSMNAPASAPLSS